MTANERVLQALAQFPYPCDQDVAEEDGGALPERYFTFNRAYEAGVDFGDNRPGFHIVNMQVHYFLPLDAPYLREKDRIREALFAHGFTYPEVTVLTEPENGIRHIVFECDAIED